LAANLAMLEGAKLAESIASGPGDLDEAVRALEEQMSTHAGGHRVVIGNHGAP
jgi:hypothetical protein